MYEIVTKSKIAVALDALGLFNEHDLDLLESCLKEKVVPKGENIISMGNVVQSIYYILEGEAYQFYFDEDNEQRVIDLFSKHSWFTDQESLTKQIPAISYIKANSDCIVLELKLIDLHQLINLSPAFLQFSKIINQN